MLVIMYIYAYRYVDSEVYINFHRFLVIKKKTWIKYSQRCFLKSKKWG